MLYRFFSKFIAVLLCFTFEYEAASAEVCNNKMVKILSINGGGVRGLIPTRVLSEIESKLNGKSIAESFDIITGTSTGAIIALMLTVPDSKGKPKYSAKQIATLYEKLSSKVFTKSFSDIVLSLNGWVGAKYSEKPLEELLKKYLQDTKLSKSCCCIVIPAYDLSRNKTKFFDTRQAVQNPAKEDFYMRDVAMAATAAPTYFKPFKLDNNVLVDGGLTLNNPIIAAFLHSFAHHGIEDINYFFVSIGTGSITNSYSTISYKKISSYGKFRWITQLLDITTDGVKNLNGEQAKLIIDVLNKPSTKQLKKGCDNHYHYLDIQIDKIHSELDNASKDNIKALLKYADQLIIKHTEDIDNIVKILNKNT